MSNSDAKLFVYGVEENLPNRDIKEEFNKFGTVTDVQNAGKGFAFVKFEKKQECEDAIKGMKKKNGFVSLSKLWAVQIIFTVQIKYMDII